MNKFGIDLGTNYIRLCTLEDGLIYNEPCMVAFDKKHHMLGIGEDAKDLIGNATVIAPLQKNPIDFDTLDILLEQLLYDFKAFRMFQKTILLVSYPTSFSNENCDILKEHLKELGAYRVYFEQEIWIAAIGAQLDLFLPVSSCVLNIGSSNCDIAIFSNGKMNKKSRFKRAGNAINVVIMNWMKQTYNISINNRIAEKIKRNVGQVMIQPGPIQYEVVGMDPDAHTLKRVIINENQLVGVLAPLAYQWANWIYDFLMELDKDQQNDVMQRGIVCCGGTMLLKGFRVYLQKALGCPVFLADDPLNTVSSGLLTLMDRMDD